MVYVLQILKEINTLDKSGLKNYYTKAIQPVLMKLGALFDYEVSRCNISG